MTVIVAKVPQDAFFVREPKIVRAIADESQNACPESIAEFNENREVLQRHITSIIPALWTAAARCSFPLHSQLWSIPPVLQRLFKPVVRQQAARTKAAAGCRSPRGRYRLIKAA